jgi:carbon monoxide dehydrogenase subunit G
VNRFSASTDSEAVVAADRQTVWQVLTDPAVLPRLTPLLRHIEADGDVWRWELTSIPVLGVSFSPSFTERMTFHPPELIEYSHQPPPGSRELAGAEGTYELTEVEGGTRLHIRLEMEVQLPLAKATRPAVRRVMKAVMMRTGERFADNLLRHLGVPR